MSRQLIWRVFALAVLGVACDDVTFVERVIIVNETDYSANVDVRGEDRGWVGIMTVGPDQTREIGQVIDQGSRWTFRFSYGNHDPVELTISKEELADAHWRVEVPVEFEENLRAEGVPPPP